MLSINKQRTSENLLYILLWGAIFFVPLLNSSLTSQDQINIDEVLASWFKISPFFLLYFVNNCYLAPKLLFKREFLLYIVLIFILSLFIFVGVDYVQENMMSRFLKREVIDKLVDSEISITDLNVFWNLFFAIMMCAANDGIKLIYKSMRDDQLMEELKRQNLQVEMDYLKYQVNPHFFMNTLNNIHALIDIDPDSAKSAVIELSKMMRYVLYESGNESISLSNDLHFITNYIELMRIRYDDSILINFNKSANLPADAKIPPLLLIVMVENAFKHGVGLFGSDNYINIDIKYIEPNIHYKVVNSIHKHASNGSKGSGIGLINLRKRLELIYGDRFELTLSEGDDSYVANLIIPTQNA